jgi:hypothetical protein
LIASLQPELCDFVTSEVDDCANRDCGMLEKEKSDQQNSGATAAAVAAAALPAADISLRFNEDFDPGSGFLSSTLACERRSVAASEQLSGACFFGVGVSPVKDDDEVYEDTISESETKRRRSKATLGKKRVSLCAEFDTESPSEEFYTPNSAERKRDGSRGELTTILDSDESCGDTVFKTVHDPKVPDSPVNEDSSANKEVGYGQTANKADDQSHHLRSPLEEISAGETRSLPRDDHPPQRYFCNFWSFDSQC